MEMMGDLGFAFRGWSDLYCNRMLGGYNLTEYLNIDCKSETCLQSSVFNNFAEMAEMGVS